MKTPIAFAPAFLTMNMRAVIRLRQNTLRLVADPELSGRWGASFHSPDLFPDSSNLFLPLKMVDLFNNIWNMVISQ